MKIAFVHPALMDYRLELFNRLNNRFDLTFIFTHHGRGQDNVIEKHLNIPDDWDVKIMTSDKLKIKGRSLIMYLKLIRELLDWKYDIIITSTSWYICFPIAKVTGKKFILLTEYWYWSSNNLSSKLLNLITRFVARNSDAIIATGAKSHEAYLDFGIENTKIFKCIQCSIDYSNLPTKNLRDELGLKEEKVILYLSRIVQRKGLDYLIRAFAMLEKETNVALLIVGDGPFRKECENLAKELKVKNAYFVGYVKDQPSYFKNCDIFVLPAIREPWGLVINEAMAFGKPIVTSDGVGAAYNLVIDEYNGYVVKTKNVQDLYKALYKIISNPELASIMGQNSRKMFEDKNDIERMFQAFENAINHVLREKTNYRGY